jgi:hypothetical protein
MQLSKVQSLQGIVAQHLIHITDKKKYCLYESLAVDGKVKNILNQVLNHNSQHLSLPVLNGVYVVQSLFNIFFFQFCLSPFS